MLSTEPFELPSNLIAKAQANDPVAMAIVGADHPVALDSAKQATEAGLIIPTLIGDAATIRKLAEDIEWDVSKIQIVNADPEEAMAQAAAILSFKTMETKPSDDSVYYFAGIDSARFKKPVSPGDQIVLNVKIDRILKGIWKYSGVASVDGAVVAEAQMMCILKAIEK